LYARNRQMAAALTVVIFLFSMFATLSPAKAAFTLGSLAGTSPYSINNFDPHVAGPIGYLWFLITSVELVSVTG